MKSHHTGNPKWPDETCAECGRTISPRMKPRVMHDSIVCTACWTSANAKEMAALALIGPPTDRQIVYARLLRIPTPSQVSNGDLSALIDKAKVDAEEEKQKDDEFRDEYGDDDEDSGTDEYSPLILCHSVKLNWDLVRPLIAASHNHCLAKMQYLKSFDDDPSERVVEPYQIHGLGCHLYLLAWQMSPETQESESWRSFRMDRIIKIEDAKIPFKPRTKATIEEGCIHKYELGCTEPFHQEVIGHFGENGSYIQPTYQPRWAVDGVDALVLSHP